jgi:polyphosphate kinase
MARDKNGDKGAGKAKDKDPAFAKPFDGAISKYLAKKAPKDMREAIRKAKSSTILPGTFPYDERMPSGEYDAAYDACQRELVKVQRWVRETGQRIALVFEGRDAAGKGGTIRRLTENLNPRHAPVVALPAPSDREQGEWYFQRYVTQLPSRGEIIFFDRSWYNRAVVEKVFGFCTDAERTSFFQQLPFFEAMLKHDGIILMKFWLSISRGEQLRRFLGREADPLKQWKLSEIDVQALDRWDDYSKAIGEMFLRSHNDVAPWTAILAEDKRRARIAVMHALLSRLDYPGKDVPPPDPKIVGGPQLFLRALGLPDA